MEMKKMIRKTYTMLFMIFLIIGLAACDTYLAEDVDNQYDEVFLFLRDFYSLYSLGERNNVDSTYLCRHTWEDIYERPLVLFQWNSIADQTFSNRAGEIFEDVIFLRYGYIVAESFRLFDFDNNDIPTIFINWTQLDTSLRGYEIFIFIDGHYQSVGSLEWGVQLFYDYAGQIVLLMNSEKFMRYAYYSLTFTDDGLLREEIFSINWDDDEFPLWVEHHNSDNFIKNPSIFGTNIPLNPITELTDLQKSVFEQLRSSVSISCYEK